MIGVEGVAEGDGTRVTQEFETVGRISAISAWLFSRGSYQGSFRGELEAFARIAEREHGSSASPPGRAADPKRVRAAHDADGARSP